MNYDHPDSAVLILGLYKSRVRPCDATRQAGQHDQANESEIHKSIIQFVIGSYRIAESKGIPVQLRKERMYPNTRKFLRLEHAVTTFIGRLCVVCSGYLSSCRVMLIVFEDLLRQWTRQLTFTHGLTTYVCIIVSQVFLKDRMC